MPVRGGANRFPAIEPLVRCFRNENGPGVARALLSDRYARLDNLAELHLTSLVLIDMTNGVPALSLVDVCFDAFRAIPESLTAQEKQAGSNRIDNSGT